LTFRMIFPMIFASAVALIGCDKQSEEVKPSIELDQGLVYHFPFDGNTTNIVNNEHYEVPNDSYLANRFNEANKALSLGCNCGLSSGLEDVRLGLGSEEGATSVWVNFNEFEESQPIFYRGYYHNIAFTDYDFFTSDTTPGTLIFMAPGTEEYSHVIPNAFQAKQWRHFLIRWSNREAVLDVFLSGKKVYSAAYNGRGVIPDPPDNPAVGGKYLARVAYSHNRAQEGDPMSYFYRGRMDDLRVYDRWLNDDEVAALAK
jgi:hypothetical protein